MAKVTKKPKPKTCGMCGIPIAQTGRGRPSKYCDVHKLDQRRAAKVARDRLGQIGRETSRADNLEAEILATRIAPFAAEISEAWRSRAMAVGLGLDSDPVRAAALVGLEGVDAVALAATAAEHVDLRQSRPAGIGRLILAAIQLAAIRLASEIKSIPASQLPAAIRASAQALELIQGGATPAYTSVELVVRAPDGTTAPLRAVNG